MNFETLKNKISMVWYGLDFNLSKELTSSLISLGIIIFFALVYIGLERKYPYDKRQKFFRTGFMNDFFWYTIVQSLILGKVIEMLIRWIDDSSGFSRLQLVSSWPVWLQCLFFLVLHDFYIYWFHRWQHHNAFLWRIHEAHHSVKDVDWVAGSRSHPLEILINQTVEFAPIVLLGAAPEVALFKGTISAVWGMYIHSNIDVRSGWLQRIINGPEMHRWHHAIDVTTSGINFGTKFAFWDWIFGTAQLPEKKPTGYGLDYVEFPENYFAQLTFAFRSFGEEPPEHTPTGAPNSSVAT